MKILDHDRTNNRQDADTAHRIIHDEAELQLQKAQTALQQHNAEEDRVINARQQSKSASGGSS
jgi:hypothetical protein